MSLTAAEIKVLQEKSKVLDVIARGNKCHCQYFATALMEKIICNGCYARRELKRIETEMKPKIKEKVS